jgi:hypothetical protein
MGAIEGILQSRGGMGGITSLQQLEDIMLMEVRTGTVSESNRRVVLAANNQLWPAQRGSYCCRCLAQAIRLSMQDAPAAPAAEEAAATPSDPSATAQAPVALSALAEIGSQGTTVANSSTASAQVSPSYANLTPAAATARAALHAGVAAGAGAIPAGRGTAYRSSSDSQDSSEYDYDDTATAVRAPGNRYEHFFGAGGEDVASILDDYTGAYYCAVCPVVCCVY